MAVMARVMRVIRFIIVHNKLTKLQLYCIIQNQKQEYLSYADSNVSYVPGELINNETVIDYEQLYARVAYELHEKQMRYWFTGEEVRRIEQLNQGYQRIVSLEGMIDTCFRRPEDGILRMSGIQAFSDSGDITCRNTQRVQGAYVHRQGASNPSHVRREKPCKYGGTLCFPGNRE